MLSMTPSQYSDAVYDSPTVRSSMTHPQWCCQSPAQWCCLWLSHNDVVHKSSTVMLWLPHSDVVNDSPTFACVTPCPFPQWCFYDSPTVMLSMTPPLLCVTPPAPSHSDVVFDSPTVMLWLWLTHSNAVYDYDSPTVMQSMTMTHPQWCCLWLTQVMLSMTVTHPQWCCL